MYSLAWDPGLWNHIARKQMWQEKQPKAYYIHEYDYFHHSKLIVRYQEMKRREAERIAEEQRREEQRRYQVAWHPNKY